MDNFRNPERLAKIGSNTFIVLLIGLIIGTAWYLFYIIHQPQPQVVDTPAADSDRVALEKKYPLIDKLPYNTDYFSINYKVTDQAVTIIITTDSPYYRYYALNKIRNLGLDPADYKIQFTNYQNPLGVSQ